MLENLWKANVKTRDVTFEVLCHITWKREVYGSLFPSRMRKYSTRSSRNCVFLPHNCKLMLHNWVYLAYICEFVPLHVMKVPTCYQDTPTQQACSPFQHNSWDRFPPQRIPQVGYIPCLHIVTCVCVVVCSL